MKLAIGLLALAIGFKAFAGPEEHLQNQTCYSIVAPETADLPPNVPAQVCLEEVSVNPNDNTVSVYSYFQPDLFKALKLTSLIRQTEDEYSFKATSVVLDRAEQVCGEGETVELQVSGRTDFMGLGDPTKLEISVTRSLTRDTCHSYPSETVYTYKIK